MAFGVEPSPTKFRLRLARYEGLAEAVAEYVNSKDEAGNRSIPMLDIGLGSGRSLMYIDKKGVGEKLDLYGLDLMPKRLDSVYGSERWKLFQGDIEGGIPFEDKSFEIVLCEQLLEHLNEPNEAIKELSRVMKKDGLLVLGVPIFPPFVNILRELIVPKLDAFTGNKKRGHIQSYTLGKIIKDSMMHGSFDLVEARGFRIASGGILKPLENKEGFYKFNRLLGRLFPSFCIEVQLLLKKI